MKAIRIIKLKLTTENSKLPEVGFAYREAANWLSKIIFSRGPKLATPAALAHEFYATIRAKFKLPSQVTCSLFRHIVCLYRAAKSTRRWRLAILKKITAPICWKRDFNLTKNGLTIWGVKTDFKSGPIPSGRWCDSKLKFIGKQWYVILTVEIDIPELKTAGTIIGIDSGIKNLFVAVEPKSNKTLYVRGGAFNHHRACIRKIKARVASVGSRSARRLLQRLRNREAAVTRDFLHVASKRLVTFAKSVDARQIVMENLQGIQGSSVKCGKKHRSQVHRWPYAQGQFFIEYKAANCGIGFEKVSSRNTSRGCPRCGHTAKANRNGLVFRCVSCKFQDNADRVGGANCCLRSILQRQAVEERAPISGLIVAGEGRGSA